MRKNQKKLSYLFIFILGAMSIAASPKRGEYIVKNVAMCIECHTPRTDSGELIQSKLYQGAAMPFTPPAWAKNWAFSSMNIDGLSKWTTEEAVSFLQTGVRPDGTRAALPMPQYRMTREDAEDVVSYLKNIDAK